MEPRDESTGIQTLPEEILLQVFSFLTSTLHTRQELYPIRTVCRLWRALINSTEEFWTKYRLKLDLTLSDGDETQQLSLLQALERVAKLRTHVPRLFIDFVVRVELSAALTEPLLSIFTTVADEVVSVRFSFTRSSNPLEFPFALLPPLPRLRDYFIDMVEIDFGARALPSDSNRTSLNSLDLHSSMELTSFSSTSAYQLGHLNSASTICRWYRLSSLDIIEPKIPLKDLFDIFVQCSSLINAHLQITAEEPHLLKHITRRHQLPHVKWLKLVAQGQYHHQFLDLLILPALKRLEILEEDKGIVSRSGPVVPTLLSLHQHSRFALKELRLVLQSFDYDAYAGLLCSLPTLRLIKLVIATNDSGSQLINLFSNPGSLPKLRTLYLADRSGAEISPSEEEVLSFLGLRGRTIRFVRWEPGPGQAAESPHVVSLVQTLQEERLNMTMVMSRGRMLSMYNFAYI